MGTVNFTMSAEITGITESDLADSLCEHWGRDAHNAQRVADGLAELTKAEFISYMLKKYVRDAYRAHKTKAAGNTAESEADTELS